MAHFKRIRPALAFPPAYPTFHIPGPLVRLNRQQTLSIPPFEATPPGVGNGFSWLGPTELFGLATNLFIVHILYSSKMKPMVQVRTVRPIGNVADASLGCAHHHKRVGI